MSFQDYLTKIDIEFMKKMVADPDFDIEDAAAAFEQGWTPEQFVEWRLKPYGI